MSATSQHEIHPDAESLSAFAERALSERERASVLAHLAVCARCRQVVALASAAAEAGMEKETAPRKTIAPVAWWRQWRLVWIPAAVAVAFAVTTISYLIERPGRQDSGMRMAQETTPPQETASQGPAQSLTPAPARQAEATPASDHARSATAEKSPVQAAPAAQRTMPGEMQPAPALESVGSAYAPRKAAAVEAEQRQAEQQVQAQVAAHQHLYAAPAMPAAAPADGQAAPSSVRQAESSSALSQLYSEHAPAAAPAPAARLQSLRATAGLKQPLQLPSGLPAVSIASGGDLLLALDNAGELYMSQDQGVSWEHVATQWTGQAIAVRIKAAARSGFSGTGSAAAPTFELSNNQNKAWVSTDGRTWSPQ